MPSHLIDLSTIKLLFIIFPLLIGNNGNRTLRKILKFKQIASEKKAWLTEAVTDNSCDN